MEKQEKIEEEKIENTQTTDQEITELRREIELLKSLFYKDKFSNLDIFRGKVQFKSGITITDIDDIEKTGGTAPIADGAHQLTTASGYYITITTKNGIITNLT